MTHWCVCAFSLSLVPFSWLTSQYLAKHTILVVPSFIFYVCRESVYHFRLEQYLLCPHVIMVPKRTVHRVTRDTLFPKGPQSLQHVMELDNMQHFFLTFPLGFILRVPLPTASITKILVQHNTIICGLWREVSWVYESWFRHEITLIKAYILTLSCCYQDMVGKRALPSLMDWFINEFTPDGLLRGHWKRLFLLLFLLIKWVILSTVFYRGAFISLQPNLTESDSQS